MGLGPIPGKCRPLGRVKAYISINHHCSLVQISFDTDPISKMCLNFHMQVIKGKCCNLKHIAIEKSVILLEVQSIPGGC